ncbi:MAG: hypothetical protein QM758_23985 [Armatimonas sp.]
MRIQIALVTLAMTAGAVMAQDDVRPRPYRLSVGTYDASTGGSRTSFNGSYDLALKSQKSSAKYSVYVDTNSKRRNGVTNSLTGFGASIRLEDNDGKSGGHLYRGAGLGLYTIKAGATRSRMGGKLFVGYERKEGVFAEADYTLIPKVSGVNASGLGLSLGYRF